MTTRQEETTLRMMLRLKMKNSWTLFQKVLFARFFIYFLHSKVQCFILDKVVKLSAEQFDSGEFEVLTSF